MKRTLALLLLGAIIGTYTPAFADEESVEPAAVQEEAPASVEASSTPDVIEATTPEDAVSLPAPEPIVATSSVELIVKFDEDRIDLDKRSGASGSAAFADQADVSITDTLVDANSAIVTVATGEDAEQAAARLAEDPSVEYAEPNYPRTWNAIMTDDPLRASSWALENTGQTVSGTTGIADADIDAPEAWQLSVGTSTIVAVIDNGVLYTHPDLAANMWDGSACMSETGTALGGCLGGYDFENNDTSPLPTATSSSDATHGTHVSGIIAAGMNNAIGTMGIAPKATIMALKFGLDVATEVRAIDFARQNGAKVINASYGGSEYSESEYDAIARFRDAGGIFVAAAGNGGTDSLSDDNEVTPQYPASYDLANIVSVAATGQSDELAPFSNYGDESVDLGAPGRRILSTTAVGGTSADYGYLSGTSMAAPFVAGTAALLMSLYPDASMDLITSALIDSGDAIASLAGKTVSGKRLNAHSALVALANDTTPPVITLTGSASISLTTGSTYTEQGATATDDLDGTVAVVIGGDTVDTSVAGTYHVTYDASDTHGNHAVQAVRTVTLSAPVVSSGGGGGGGGGGGSSKKRSKSSTAKTTAKAATTVTTPAANPVRQLFAPVTAASAPSVAPAPVFLYTRLLTVGSMGADVTALQQALTRAGVYTGPVTGYFGPLTAAGVRAYQAAHALEAVGFVGPMTRALLNQGI